MEFPKVKYSRRETKSDLLAHSGIKTFASSPWTAILRVRRHCLIINQYNWT